MLNFRSGEYYLVCIGKKKIPEKLIKNLCKPGFTAKKVNDFGFLLQLFEFSKQIIEKRNKQLERLLNLMNNYKSITKSEHLLIGKIREKRIKEWIKKYNIV